MAVTAAEEVTAAKKAASAASAGARDTATVAAAAPQAAAVAAAATAAVAAAAPAAQPLEIALVESYLKPRVKNHAAYPLFHEVDFYACSPDDLSHNHEPLRALDGSSCWYFFTPLQPKGTGSSGIRSKRAIVVDGVTWVWHSDRSSKAIFATPDSKVVIGYRQMFAFAKKDVQGSVTRTGWLMLEVRLKQDTPQQVVLCKLYRRKPRRGDTELADLLALPPRPLALQQKRHPSYDKPGEQQQIADTCGKHSPSHMCSISLPHDPGDEQLITRFLTPRVTTGVITHERDVFSQSPQALSRFYQASVSTEGTSVWYFYSHRVPWTMGGVHPVKSGAGSWFSQDQPEDVVDTSGKIIGKKQMFYFYEPADNINSDNQSQGFYMGWAMLELLLYPVKPGNVAFYKIFQQPIAPKRKACPVTNETARKQIKLTYHHSARGHEAEDVSNRDKTGGGMFYALFIRAELSNLTNLQPSVGCNTPRHSYQIKVRCNNCRKVAGKLTCASLNEDSNLSSGTDILQKCDFCGSKGSIVMIPGIGSPLTAEQSRNGGESCLMVFECNGFELVEFGFGNGWTAESVHGTKFEIDLSDGTFRQYDKKGNCWVAISHLQLTFEEVTTGGG